MEANTTSRGIAKTKRCCLNILRDSASPVSASSLATSRTIRPAVAASESSVVPGCVVIRVDIMAVRMDINTWVCTLVKFPLGFQARLLPHWSVDPSGDEIIRLSSFSTLLDTRVLSAFMLKADRIFEFVLPTFRSEASEASSFSAARNLNCRCLHLTRCRGCPYYQVRKDTMPNATAIMPAAMATIEWAGIGLSFFCSTHVPKKANATAIRQPTATTRRSMGIVAVPLYTSTGEMCERHYPS
jgi:hypothetical protein